MATAGASGLLREVALASVGIGASLFLGTRLARAMLDRLAARTSWYPSLAERHKKELAHAITCIAHHSLVCVGSLAALHYQDELLFRRALLLEIGFDVYDTLATPLGEGLTGMGALPVTLHHTVALLMDYAAFATALLPWRTSAAMAAVLLGSGAVDLLVVRVLRHTPVYRSASMIYVSGAQFALFLLCRVAYFGSAALAALRHVAHSPHAHAGLLLRTPVAVLSLYHALLGAGLLMALRNGGRMPERPKP